MLILVMQKIHANWMLEVDVRSGRPHIARWFNMLMPAAQVQY